MAVGLFLWYDTCRFLDSLIVMAKEQMYRRLFRRNRSSYARILLCNNSVEIRIPTLQKEKLLRYITSHKPGARASTGSCCTLQDVIVSP